MFADIALIAYITDLIFGEFSFIKHPVVLMGEYIDKFEKNFSFNFNDIDENNHTISVKDKKITIDNSKEVILLNFFSSKSPPCQGQIPYLIDNDRIVILDIFKWVDR